ncbi:hypothetical protein HXX76_007546 [Chlamydomonas incerta]|uniref:phytol kinase n=1 Tax=Chlamydomonas incerta TaxID=51695 RepID=A0A835VZ51_CHLIN|nr:hypothetical protein HXX76_007546 [Chlamydomonas incerta]|eukprot:KAG2434652.1 hypothetical protein HXX76_007546 [Chlamydomonas incerta]
MAARQRDAAEAFRREVEQLARALQEADPDFARVHTSCLSIYDRLRDANNAPGPDGQRELFRRIDSVLCSRAWSLLFRWHSTSLGILLAAPFAAEAVEAAWEVGGGGVNSRGQPLDRAGAVAALGIHGAALRLMTGCMCHAAAAAQGEDAGAHRPPGLPAPLPPPPPPGLVDRMARSHRALIASGSFRAYARLAAQAADAAAATAGDVGPQQQPGAPSAQVLEDVLSSFNSLVESACGFLRQPGVVARCGGPTTATARPTRQQAQQQQQQPLNVLLLSELASSGLNDQVARLVVHTAAADGRWWLRNQHRLPAADRGGGLAAALAQQQLSSVTTRAGATRDLASGLCTLLLQSGLLWMDCVDDMEAGSGTPPPPPWGACLDFLALAHVAATLAAAGFGGGARGVWGLPAELAEGLPVLGLAPSQGGGGRAGWLAGAPAFMLDQLHTGARDLSSWPFRHFMHTLCVAERAAWARRPAAAAGQRAAAATATAAAAVADSSEAAAGWRFPVSARAATEVLLAVVALATDSMDSAVPRGTAGHRGSSHQMAALGPRLRLTYSDAWEVGMDAVSTVKHILPAQLTGGQQRPSAPSAPATAVPAGAATAAAAVAAAPSGGAGGAGSNAHGVGRAGDGDGMAVGMDSDGGGSGGNPGGGSGGYPPMPYKYWRAAAAVLRRCACLPTGASGESLLPSQERRRVPVIWVKQIFKLTAMPGAKLPPRPPRALQAALAGGLVVALEAAVRTASDADLALRLANAFFSTPEDFFQSGAAWPHFQQLLAFAPPAQTAGLITSLGKRAHEAVDALAIGGGGSSACVTERRLLELLTGVVGTLPDTVEPLRSLQPDSSSCSSSSAGGGSGSSGGSGGGSGNGSSGAGSGIGFGGSDSGGEPRPMLLMQRQVRLLVSHTLHRWLPALSRCLRGQVPTTQYLSLLSLEAVLTFTLRLALRPLGEVAVLDSQADDPSGPWAASAAPAADSWRQWLLREVGVVALAELGLRILAALPRASMCAMTLGALIDSTLSLLPVAVPDVLAATLRLPLPRGSPWHPDQLRRVLLLPPPAPFAPEREGVEARLATLRALGVLREKADAVGDDLAQLRGHAYMPPLVRAAMARSQLARRPDLPPLPLSPHEAAVEASALAAGVEAEAASGGSRGGGRPPPPPPPQQQQQQQQQQAAPQQQAGPQLLRWCANPRCANLAGESEADLPLSMCAGCRCVRYCSRSCQAAHWRGGGHKAACPALRAAAAATAAAAAAAAAATAPGLT